MTSPPGIPPPAVPAPPRRPRRLRTILIVVGVVAFLCCAGAVIGGVTLFRSANSANNAVRDATESFVTDLQSGDYAGAYGQLCADTRTAFSQSQFSQGVQSQPRITSHNLTGSSVSNVNGRVSAQVAMDLTLDSGFVERHIFVLVKEGGVWKVCGQPY